MAEASGNFARKMPRRVWVYTRDQAYLATLHLYTHQRLLDLLNDQRTERRLFLPLTDVQVRQRAAPQRSETHPFVALNYRAICLAGEVGVAPFPATGTVPRHQVAVRLDLENQVSLTGHVHCALAERVVDLLNREERFLPLTDVAILAASAEGEASLPFVAVNRERIVRVVELPDVGYPGASPRRTAEHPGPSP